MPTVDIYADLDATSVYNSGGVGGYQFSRTTSTQIEIGNWTGGASPPAESRLCARFPVGSIPSNAVVSAATLSLYCNGVGGMNGKTTTIYTCGVAWDETQPQSGVNPTPTNALTGAVALPTASDQFFTPSLSTTYVQQWIAGTLPNYGLILMPNGMPWQAGEFHAREFGSGTTRPFLTITYTVPPTISPSSPANASTLASTPTLQVAVTEAESVNTYVEFQWSQSATFASGVTTENTATQAGPLSSAAFTRTPATLAAGTWYWRARARSSNGLDSAYTTTRSFTLNLSPKTFSYTGAEQTFVVPDGVTTMQMECWGAQGGTNGTIRGGYGGYAKGTITVTPGETLRINVGGQGVFALGTAAGGWNGGGGNINAGWQTWGGGGASDVRRGGTALVNRVMVGAGGGGAHPASDFYGTSHRGGDGGAATGEDGGNVGPSQVKGGGGTQSAGGTAGIGERAPEGTAGSLGQGGDGARDDAFGAPGGGGGYYGGGCGGTFDDNSSWGGGGGGSNLVTGTSTVTTRGIRTGNGQVVLTYATASTAPTAPTLTAPAANAPMNLVTGQFQWQFNDVDPGDAQSAYAFRRRAFGSGSYEWWSGTAWQGTEVFVNGAFNYVTITSWTASDDTYYWSVATKDIAGNTSAYATERLVNPWEWWDGADWVSTETFITDTTTSAQIDAAEHASGQYKWTVATKDAAGATGPYAPANQFTFGVGTAFERFGNFI